VKLLLSVVGVLAAAGAVAAAAAAASESACDDKNDKSCTMPDYLIVGAGGSGIEMALFLEKYNHSYTVLEKENVVGSFWTQFPRFDELISVNKLARNETQHFRYDWHSFLEAPLLMTNLTKEYFPTGGDWHRYMAKSLTWRNSTLSLV